MSPPCKAATQDGYFTIRQAQAAGYSAPLLAKYLRNGKVQRAHRGIYRLVHFPPGEHEDLVVTWLWAKAKGAFSHETALALHQLSEVLPAQVHLTLPASWAVRRLRVPTGVQLHFADVTKEALTCCHGPPSNWLFQPLAPS